MAMPTRLALALDEFVPGGRSGAQRKAALAAGIQQSTISRALDPDRLAGVSANQLVRLARALRVRIGWLLTGEEPMRPHPPGTQLVFIERPAEAKDEPARADRRRK